MLNDMRHYLFTDKAGCYSFTMINLGGSNY